MFHCSSAERVLKNNREISYKWSEEITVLFLSLLRQHECLWNSKRPKHKNKARTNQALNSFVDKLNIPNLTVLDVKTKIKTLPSRYSSELSKVIMSEKTGNEEVRVPKLYWYKQADDFLRSICTPKNYGSPNIKLIDEDQESEDDCSNNLSIDNDSIQISEKQNDCEIRIEDINPITRIKSHSKKRNYSTFDCIDQAIDKLRKISDETKEEETEFDIFCKSLAAQLNKMPLDRALLCQQGLMKVMTEERLCQIKMQQLQVQIGGCSSIVNHDTSHCTNA